MVVDGNWKDGTLEIANFVRSQIKSLQSLGWKVFVGVVDDRTSIQGIVRNVQRLKEEVAQSRPGLIHAQYGSVTAAVAHWVRGSLPLVVSFCGDDLLGTPNPGLYWRIRERCARASGLWAARRAALIIVKSNNLLQALPVSLRDKATVLPNGVDVSWFRSMNREECRAKLGWNRQLKVVLFNASQRENQESKNPSLARATADLLTRSVPDVYLHMMANASQEEVRLMLNAADCLLVTSLHEGSPNIVKEAMASNLPIVSVPCGDVAERLRKTYPGGIRPYDACALVEAIQEVFKAGCRSNGREQIIAQRLSAAEVAKRLIQLYQDLQKRWQQEVRRRTCAV